MIDWAWTLANCAQSLRRVFLGVAVAAALGITLGLLRSALPEPLRRNRALAFLLEVPKFPPPIAWIPFVILAFGIGELAATVIVFIGAFAPVFTSAYEGALSVPRILKDTARSLEMSGPGFLARIIFPAALPQIFTGLRAGVSMGWMSVIAAEMISGQSGLGYSIQLNRLNMQYEQMTVDMFLIGALGFLLFEAIRWLERLTIPWHEKAGGS